MAAPLYIADAQRIALSHVASPLPGQTLAPPDALGARLAADVLALRPHPPFPAAIKDGFAVTAGDVFDKYLRRDVVSASRAGAAAEQPALSKTQTAYVTTGAPMPPGTDAVVQIEWAASLGGGETVAATPNSSSVSFGRSIGIQRGSEVRAVGSDIPLGSTVLRAHERIGPAEIGLLATVGCAAVDVFTTPRVGVLSTGDELADAFPSRAEAPPSGHIHDCNRPMLRALCTASGAETVDLGMASDSADELEARLDAALEGACDVLVCSGGVSMGDRDLVKPLLAKRGTVHFGKVVMKPGKPLTFATVPRRSDADGASGKPPLLVFGLPGNPVSAFACFHLVVAPVLRKLSGDLHPLPRRVQAILGAGSFKMDPERPEYHRSILQVTSSGELVAHSTGGQISSRLLSCRHADALLELPARKGVLPKGTVVTALLVGGIERGAGMGGDELREPLLPTPYEGSHALLPRTTSSSQAPIVGGCRVGVLVHADSNEEGHARTAEVLDALGDRLVPGSWLSHARVVVGSGDTPMADEAVLKSTITEMLSHTTEPCSVVLCLSLPTSGRGVAIASAVAAASEKAVPALGSLMRSACLQTGDAVSGLLGNWVVGVARGGLVLSLPAEVKAAMACVDAVAPAMQHALSQLGGERPPPRLRQGGPRAR
jgi:gephyrin